jgi:hypothetical protein
MMSDHKKVRPEAIWLLHLLDRAILSIHPDKYQDDDDAAIVLQPLRVSLNYMLGRAEEQRFFPVEYDALIERTCLYAERGFLAAVEQSSRELIVVNALINAAMHEIRIVQAREKHDEFNLGAEVKASAKTLIMFVNRGTTEERQSIPKNQY